MYLYGKEKKTKKTPYGFQKLQFADWSLNEHTEVYAH